MNRPPIKKECPKCEGSGIKAGLAKEDAVKCPIPEMYECDECNGTGELYNYLTPQQWEAETGEKLADNAPLWVYYNNKWNLHEAMFTNTINALVVMDGQPKPPEEYNS